MMMEFMQYHSTWHRHVAEWLTFMLSVLAASLSMLLQEAIYNAEKDVQQMSGRVQREQADLQRRAATLADTGLKQEAEKQRLQLERQSWDAGEAERLRLDAAARDIKQQTQHLKVGFCTVLLT